MRTRSAWRQCYSPPADSDHSISRRRNFPVPAQITMPQQSDTMTEGTVVKWHKKVGDAVNGGEEVADIETDKATMPLEIFDEQAGTLAAILVKEGQKAKVGDPIAVIALKGEK